MSEPSSTSEMVMDVIASQLQVQLRREALTVETPLFDGGLNLDSFSVVDLISLLENRFGVQFAEMDFREEHFQTIGTLSRLIDQRRTSALESRL